MTHSDLERLAEACERAEQELRVEAARSTFRILLAVCVIVALGSGVIGYLLGRFS